MARIVGGIATSHVPAIGRAIAKAAPEYRNADEGWGIPTLAPLAGHQALSWHVIESLVNAEFDPVTCQEMLVDHAVNHCLRPSAATSSARLWLARCNPGKAMRQW